MNIFLIVFDTLRKDHCGKTYGNHWIKTPNIDEFAADSIVFEKAYPESLPTIPARRALHTGLRTFPFNHKKPELRTDDYVEAPGWNPIPPHQTHMAEYLNGKGYTTCFVTSTYHQFKPNMNFHLGFDEWHYVRGHESDKVSARMLGTRGEIRKKIDQYVLKETKENKLVVRSQRLILKKYLANRQLITNEAEFIPVRTFNKSIEIVKKLKKLKNLFLLIDEFDPHEPWDPPDRFLDLYIDKNYMGNKIIFPLYGKSVPYYDKGELNCMKACYAAEVSFCDYWFGKFLENLKELEIYNDSLIILTSDHGHGLGEHKAIGKVPSHLYPELVDIPLIIKPPFDFRGPKRVKMSYVYIHDILPTIFGYLGAEIPKIFEGSDLSVFTDKPDDQINNRNYSTNGMGLWTLYKDDDFAMITSNDQQNQKLFDLSKDPEWNVNIANTNKEKCDELFKKIEFDAHRDLLLKFTSSRFENYEEWYQNTYLT